jgi:hypothetical protein
MFLEGVEVKKARFTEEQIIGGLRQMASGRTAADMAREMGVSKHTIYAWNQKYGGMQQRRRQAVETFGRGEPAAEDGAGRGHAGPRCKGGDPKKRMELVSRREDVAFAMAKFDISQRRACELMQIDRASCRYESRQQREPEVKQQMAQIAEAHPRFGYVGV